MKILISGATGFIAKHLIKAMLDKGHDLILTSRRADFKAPKGTEYIPLDIETIPDTNLFQYFAQPDILIHLAWSNLPNYESTIHIEKNVLQHYLFIKNLTSNGLKRVVVTGTCLEYGMHEGCMFEEHPSVPSTAYGLAKHTLRLFLDALRNELQFELLWVRLFYLFGDGQNTRSLYSQLLLAMQHNAEIFEMSEGSQLRDFLPVETAAEYLADLSLSKGENGIVNCCSGVPITVRDFVENLMKKHNKQITLKLGAIQIPSYEPLHFWGANIKLKGLLRRSF